MASEEWVSEYNKKQETQSDFDRKLEDRYEGIQLVNSWSRCLSYALITIVISAFPRSATKFEATCMTRN